MNADDFARFQRAAEACAIQMFSNALYVERELPNVRMPDELRLLASKLCEAWVATKHDVISSTSAWDEEPFDEALCARRVAMIMDWLRADIEQAHELVQALDTASAEDPGLGSAHILIAESAVNVLKSFSIVCDI